MPTLSFDTTLWSDDERTLIIASVYGAAVLDCSPVVNTAGMPGSPRWLGLIAEVDLPAADPVHVLQLTETKVRARYTTDKNARNAAAAAEAAELAAQASYTAGDPILSASVATIRAYVDQTRTEISAAGNAAQYRSAMLRLLTIHENILKLLYARGLIGVQ